ncbi:MAG: serine hydrolase domain-containing protein [Glycocaulis sp.]
MLTLIAAALALALASPGVDEAAEALLDDSGAPGAVVALLDDDGVHIGVAGTRIHRRDAPVEADDLWHMGSNTKAMTATLVARLVEQGVVRWEMTVGEVLGSLDLDIHDDLAGADFAALLMHRSGLAANAGPITAIRLGGTDSSRDAAADRLIYARAVLGSTGGPAGEFLYSNAGYVIAALMLEQLTGETYETLMEREVFGPLRMGSAGWGPPGIRDAADQPRGHRPGLFGFSAIEPGASADNPPALNPAGRAHMTMADLLRFLDIHRRGAAGEETGYLSVESFERLHRPEGNYAMGWGVREDGTLSHSGSNTMWLVTMRIDASRGVAAAAGVNDGRLDTVAGPVSAALNTVMAEPD